MKNPKKVIFIDVDGTLLHNPTKSVPDSAINAIKQIKSNPDFDLYLATGRSQATIKMLDPIIDCFKGKVLMNGALTKVNEDIIRYVTIDQEDLKELVSLAHEYPMGLLTNDTIYLNYADDITKHILRDFSINNVINLERKDFDFSIKYCSAWIFTTNENCEQINSKLTNLRTISWGVFGCDVIYKKDSKANGIQAVLDKEGYQLENTFAIGDSDNDLEMLKMVNLGICMGNGTEKAKKASDYITDDILQDGIANALRYILLLSLV